MRNRWQLKLQLWKRCTGRPTNGKSCLAQNTVRRAAATCWCECGCEWLCRNVKVLESPVQSTCVSIYWPAALRVPNGGEWFMIISLAFSLVFALLLSLLFKDLFFLFSLAEYLPQSSFCTLRLLMFLNLQCWHTCNYVDQERRFLQIGSSRTEDLAGTPRTNRKPSAVAAQFSCQQW